MNKAYNFYSNPNLDRYSIKPEVVNNLAAFLEKDEYLLRLVSLEISKHLINVYESLFQKLLITDEQKFLEYFFDKNRQYPQFILTTSPSGPLGKPTQVQINLDEDKAEEVFRKILMVSQEVFKILNIWEDSASFIMNNMALFAVQKMDKEIGEQQLEAMSDEKRIKIYERYLWEEMKGKNDEDHVEKLEFLLNKYSQLIIPEIIEALDIGNITLEDLDKFLGFDPSITKPSIPVTESRLTEPIIPIPTSVALFSSIKAQLRKDLWQQDSQANAYLKHEAKGNQNNYIEHYITHPGQIQILPWKQAEQIIDKFGFDTVKLHLILAAHTMKYERPWENKFTLKATDIIHYLGWEKRTDLPVYEKLNKIAQMAFVLDCLLVKSVWIEGKNSKGGINASTPVGRIWNMVIDPRGQLNLEGKVDKPEEVYITIQPGLIFQSFLNKGGSQMKEALYQFGYLAQHILKIDPYHQELTFRLAIHITIESRYHKNGLYQVETLLKSILPSTIVNEAYENKSKAHRLKKRWDKAIEDLQNLDWQIQFDESYPEWLQPSSQRQKPSGSKKIPLIKHLLQAKIIIKPPEITPKLTGTRKTSRHKTPNKTPKQKPPTTTPTQLTPNKIRQARKAQGWSQRELAKQLEVSNGLVGSWETGKRTPTSEMETKLQKLLNITLE